MASYSRHIGFCTFYIRVCLCHSRDPDISFIKIRLVFWAKAIAKGIYIHIHTRQDFTGKRRVSLRKFSNLFIANCLEAIPLCLCLSPSSATCSAGPLFPAF